ncbi:unnamed protein product [Phaedon cochleariae]|uniref:Uncharacterized protein n=1 Tax=Phaedon cochleariae TaxID=80249 RepID=A0A9P0DXG6_PHACE|nr:unnamed protein product [Phaedon cochleariae]
MIVQRLKLCCRCETVKLTKRFLTNVSPNVEILSDLLGVSTETAKHYVSEYKLHYRDGDNIINNIRFCQNLGFSNESILKTKHLLSSRPVELEGHFMAMQEGGFHDIGPKTLAKARTLMKRRISFLKSEKFIHKTTNVPKYLISYIEDKNIAAKIPEDYSDEEIWNVIQSKIIQTYLRLRLGATEDDIIKLFRIHKIIKNKSLRFIQENIRLAEDLGFEHRRILKYGYILHSFPAYTQTTLTDLSNLAGANMRQAMLSYPKLFMTDPKNIIKIYGILKEFDIPDEIIRKQMNIFHMSPETVKLRLQEIEKSPDLKVLFSHPRILKLIVHHNRTKSRLSFLQQLQLRCATLSILKTDQNDEFEEYIKEGKDVNKLNDLICFLKDLFSLDEKSLKKMIKLHPFHLQVPLKDMKDTFDYLREQKFKKTSIYKVLYILLYPKEKVRNILTMIRYNKDIKFNSLSEINKLNLILYFIEKEHHFTGNGIWRKCDEPKQTVD